VVSNLVHDKQRCSEAESLCKEVKNFNFLVTVVFWYDLMFQINLVSKELQSECKDLASAIDSLEKTCKWLKNYRNTGFAVAVATARELEILRRCQSSRTAG